MKKFYFLVNSDVVFNTLISDFTAYGKGNGIGGFVGEVDLQTFGCLVNPQNGNWFIVLSSDTLSLVYTDEVALKLSSSLVIGNTYQLSFYVYGNTPYVNRLISNIEIGESLSDTSFGNLLYQAIPIDSAWSQSIFNFSPSQSAQYITVKIVAGQFSWNQVDNLVLTNVTGINESNVSISTNLFPNPFTDKLNITTTICEPLEFIHYDITSRKLLQKNFITETTINTECLSKGVYIYEVYSNNLVLQKGKILKQ